MDNNNSEQEYLGKFPKNKKSFSQDKAPAPKVYFEKSMWKGIIPTYKCSSCEHWDDLDGIILHVVVHVPEDERDALLEKLLLLKEN